MRIYRLSTSENPEYYMDVGHDSSDDTVFLWYMDKTFKIHKKKGQGIGPTHSERFPNMFPLNGTFQSPAFGRYVPEENICSVIILGSWLEENGYKADSNMKKYIEDLLKDEFSPDMKIHRFLD